MAIRIERDEPTQPDPQPQDPRDPRRGGGKNPLLALLPLLLLLFTKNPKLAIIILAIGGAAYFLTDGFQNINLPTDEEGNLPVSPFSAGLDLNPEQFASTMNYEPLANSSKNPFPPAFSLQKFAPTRLNQGRQGSCVGWASAYSARTILRSRETGEDPNSIRFSPSFLYNQIALQGCQGSYLMDAMENMKNVGSLPLSEFTYTEASCTRAPSSNQKRAANDFRIKGYNRLTKGGYRYEVDIPAIKQNIAKGAPVVIGMQVGGTFMRSMTGRNMWRPNAQDRSLRGFGGHAMSVIGYDDNREGGAFQIMNSWGEGWGDKGIAWVKYTDFKFFTKEAYGLYPMGKADNPDETKLAASFGIVANATQANIPLKRVSQNVYQTSMQKQTRFKLEVTNSIACNTYIFAEQVDGSSEVLFPYDDKSNPYCGITGTRLFPRTESLYPDDDGNLDRFAIVVTKKEIDYVAINKKISQSKQGSYAAKILEAIGSDHVEQMNFKDGGATVDFDTDLKGKNAVSVVIEVKKK